MHGRIIRNLPAAAFRRSVPATAGNHGGILEFDGSCIYANQFEIFIGNNDMVRGAPKVMESTMYKANMLSTRGMIPCMDSPGSRRMRLYRKRAGTVGPA